MVAATFDKTDLCNSDLTDVRAIKARFVDAILRGANFDGADVAGADFRRADLRGANMRARNLDQAEFSGAVTDARTLWPNGFDASTAQLVTKPAVLRSHA